MTRSLMLGCELKPEHGKIKSGNSYSFGAYFPKYRSEHKTSSWSQLVLRAKRLDLYAVSVIAEIITAHLQYWLSMENEYTFCHVPAEQTYTNKKENGMTCSSLLAVAICSSLTNDYGVDFDSTLTQTRAKMCSQHRCTSFQERHKNVQGCYASKTVKQLRGRTMILVDDIITTGATMKACALALKNTGCNGVIGVAAARTVKYKR